MALVREIHKTGTLIGLIQQDSPRAMTAQDLKHFKARFQRIPSLPSSCCTCIFFILSLTLSRFQHAFWQSDNQPWSGKSTHGLNGWVSGFVVTHRYSVTRLWPSETEATLRIAYHRFANWCESSSIACLIRDDGKFGSTRKVNSTCPIRVTGSLRKRQKSK